MQLWRDDSITDYSIVERIPAIKDLVKRLVNDPLFRLDCGFLISDFVSSEASYSSIICVISESDILDKMQDQLIQTAFLEGLLSDEHLAIQLVVLNYGRHFTRNVPL